MSMVAEPEKAHAISMAPDTKPSHAAQQQWAALPVAARLRVVRRLRHLVAQRAEQLAAAVPCDVPGSLHRTVADTLVAEVLPLAEACRYMERHAVRLLAPRKLSRVGQPFFLRRVHAFVERVPWGTVLVIGPANYPLFLPGVQTLQALVAGNAVLWKPAPAGEAAANLLRDLLLQAGLPAHLLTVLDSSISAAEAAIAKGVDKVVLTGHISTGRAVLRQLAESATPAVMELSGCDALFVLPGADLEHAARAIVFGLRLNGSATCMAPRRLFVDATAAERLLSLLHHELRSIPPITLPARVLDELQSLVRDAEDAGAVISAGIPGGPVLISGAMPYMRCMRTDIFAPLLSVMQVSGNHEAVAAYDACPYALTASVFGPEPAAAALAAQLRAGTVLINDVIVPTADPRLPFVGRGQSGFGATRGAEGLLEMTTLRTTATQRSRSLRPYAPTGPQHTTFFAAYIRAGHSSTWAQRIAAMRALAAAARHIPSPRPRSTPPGQ